MRNLNTSKLTKAFLRWAGSKKKLIPVLSQYYSNNYNKYIEPFVGSAQLFFNLPLNKAILSDINVDLINMYKLVQLRPLELYNILISFEKGKEAYYSIREVDLVDKDDVFKAARFIYLNTYCFNGLYRTNNSGKFNVPFSESSGKLISLEELLKVSDYIKKAEFLFGDFENIVLDNCESNDFVYLDPPYAVRNKRIFSQYTPDTFGLNDLERLKSLIEEIDKRGAKFVLSYAECDEANFLSVGWNNNKVSTIRNISGFAVHRKQENEVLITNIDI